MDVNLATHEAALLAVASPSLGHRSNFAGVRHPLCGGAGWLGGQAGAG